jgi:hypothetical protein
MGIEAKKSIDAAILVPPVPIHWVMLHCIMVRIIGVKYAMSRVIWCNATNNYFWQINLI